MAISAVQLTGLFGANITGGGLLEIAYGLGKAPAQPGGGNPVLALRQAERDRVRDIGRTAARPEVARDIAAFRAGVAKAASPAALLDDPKVMRVLLTANGLGDQIGATALARKALLSDISDSDSLANRLGDTRWKSVAQTYDFARQGLARLREPQVMATLENAYAEVTWRRELDAATPGLSDALTFREQAGKATSALAILGDPVLRRVVTTTLGLPLQIAFQSVEAQETAITSRLDISMLADAKFVAKFVDRYLITRAQQQDDTTTGGNDLASLARKSAGLVV